MNPLRYESGQLRCEIWKHRVNPSGPAYREWYESGQLKSQTVHVYGKRVVNLRRYLTRRRLIQ